MGRYSSFLSLEAAALESPANRDELGVFRKHGEVEEERRALHSLS